MKVREAGKRLSALAMAVATAASLMPQTAYTAYAASCTAEQVSVQEIPETRIGTGETDISTASITQTTSLTYDGTTTYKPTFAIGGKTLNPDTDYTIKSGTAEAKDAGIYYVTIAGTGSYTGEKRVSWNISRKQAEIKELASTDEKKYNLTPAYTGDPIAEPKRENFSIEAASDENVSFTWYDGDFTSTALDEEKKRESEPINVGTYTLVINVSTAGNYSQNEAKFKVEVKKATAAAELKANELTYTGKEQALVTVKTPADEGCTIYYSNTANIDFSANGSTTIPKEKNAGTYKVYYRIKGDSNHEDSAEASIEVEIKKASPNISDVKAPVQKIIPYNGKEQELVKAGETSVGTLEYSIDNQSTWSTEVPKGKNAGDYVVYYRVQADSTNVNASDVQSVTTTIKKAELTADNLKLDSSSVLTKTYDGTTAVDAGKIKVVLQSSDKVTIDGTVFVTGTAVYNDANADKADTITFTTTADDTNANYTIPAGLQLSIQNSTDTPVAVSQAEPTLSDVKATAAAYRQTLADSTITGTATLGTGTDAPKVAGDFAFDAPDTILAAIGSADYAYTFQPKDEINYKSVSGTVSVTVEPKVLNATLTGSFEKVYDTKTNITLTGTELSLTLNAADIEDGETVTIDTDGIEYAFEKPDVGTNLKIIAKPKSGHTGLTGTDAAHYQLPEEGISANVGTINKQAVTPTAPSAYPVATASAESYYYDLSGLLDAAVAADVTKYEAQLSKNEDGVIDAETNAKLTVTGATLAIPVSAVADEEKKAEITVSFTGKNYEIADVVIPVETKKMTAVKLSGITVQGGDSSETPIGADTAEEKRVLTYVKGTAVSVVDTALKISKAEGGGLVSDAGTLTYTWYKVDADGNKEKLTAAPEETGDYALLAVTDGTTYHGTLEIPFTIKARDIKDAEITLKDDALIYNGTGQTFTITQVTVNGTALVVKDDYLISEGSDQATDAGTYTLIIEGTGNYEGTAEKTFEIKKASIAAAVITLEQEGKLTYNGKVQNPVKSVEIEGITGALEEGTDYTILQSETAKNVGTYSFALSGKGNFTGMTDEASFTIAQAKPHVALIEIKVTGEDGMKLSEVPLTELAATVSQNDTTPISGTWSWKNKEQELQTGENEVYASFTSEDENFTDLAAVIVKVTVEEPEEDDDDTDDDNQGENPPSNPVTPTNPTPSSGSNHGAGNAQTSGSGNAQTSGSGSAQTSGSRQASTETETGWVEKDGTWYYYSEDGETQTGWELVNGSWYYMDSTGAMQTGWIQDGEIWYYASGSGAMQIGWVNDGDIWYYTSGSGAMQTGWVNDGGTWYYTSGSGAMQTGWQLIDGTWYYLSDSGAMQTGWQLIGGTWYYLSGSGAMQTGWQRIGGSWYYLSGSGAMQTGWYQVGGKWYYSYASGVMAANTRIGSYRIDANGVWVR
ncbi:MAG: hypothetical protein IJ567_02170 [Lachnospiraceae bacterium]|nr:hypothetical protein [Lachnospiraceae bacterium]